MALPQRSAPAETETATPYPKLLPRPGRPSLFSPERTALICELIRLEGISDCAAGALAGVTASTLSRWKQEDEEFALQLEQARARFELELVRGIRSTRKRDGTPDWRAIAWLLKNSSPEGYRPNPRRRKGAQEEKNEKCANVPETPRAGSGPEERTNVVDTVPGDNSAFLPETPGDAPAPKLSRQQRRAKERRLAKEAGAA